MIDVVKQSDIHWLNINHGKVNGMDEDLCNNITHQVETFENSAASCLLLRAANPKRIFSAGIDLKYLMRSDIAHTRRFFPALIRLFETVYYSSKPDYRGCRGGCDRGRLCPGGGMHNANRQPKCKVWYADAQAASADSPSGKNDIAIRGSSQNWLINFTREPSIRANEALQCELVTKVTEQESIESEALALAREFVKGKFQPNQRDPNLTATYEAADKLMIEQWCTDELRGRVQSYIKQEL